MPILSPSIPQKLSTQIYKELQNLLIAGEFRPGEKLRVAELVSQTGTSVTPVREALIQLVSENAVEMYSSRAFAIPPLNIERFREIRAMRVGLERIATEHAAKNLKACDIKRLAELHQAFVSAETTHEVKAALRSNQEFHFIIYRAANMPLLLAAIEALWAMMGPILNVYYEKMNTVNIGAQEHINVIEALRKGDAIAAGRSIEADLLSGCKRMEKYIEAYTG